MESHQTKMQVWAWVKKDPPPAPPSGEGGGGGWDVPCQRRVSRRNETPEHLVRLLAVDHSARASMKGMQK